MKKIDFIKSVRNKLALVAIILSGFMPNDALAQAATNTFWGNTTGDSNWATAANWSGTTRSAFNVSYTSGESTVTITSVTATVGRSLNTSGLAIVGPGIPNNTTITAHSASILVGTRITLSNPITGSGTALVYVYEKAAAAPGTTSNAVIEYGLVTGPTVAATTTVQQAAVRNTFGPITGCTLTIAADATLNISATNAVLALAGGNVINNGTLNITNTGTGATSGITCASPTAAPDATAEYSYSGTGNLNINISTSTAANSAGISVFPPASPAVQNNSKYKFTLDSSKTTFSLGALASHAFRCTGALSVLTIEGSVKLGTVDSPSRGGLLSISNGAKVNIPSETTLEMNSIDTNLSNGLSISNASATAKTTLTNDGSIKIYGNTGASGIIMNTFSGANNPNIGIDFINAGTVDVNINAVGAATTSGTAPNITTNNSPAALTISNAFGTANTNAIPTITNTGTFTLKNTATPGLPNSNGQPIWVTSAGERARPVFNNNTGGTLTLDGTANIAASSWTLNNNATVKSNVTLTGFTAINNSSTGIFDFSTLATTAADGSSAVTGNMTNTGTIKTGSGAAAKLGNIGAIIDDSTGIIAPGGNVYGKINLNRAAPTPDGTIQIQVAGNTEAGTDYDQLRNTAATSVTTLTNLVLNITALYTPTANVSIPIVEISGTDSTLSGTFESVTGLAAKWSLEYTTTGVNLVYDASTLANKAFDTFKFSVYPNPTAGTVNITAAKNISNVSFYNLLGQKVKTFTVNASNKQLDITGLQKGVYIMEATIDNSTKSFKIVKD